MNHLSVLQQKRLKVTVASSAHALLLSSRCSHLPDVTGESGARADSSPLLLSCSCATAYILLAEEEATTIMEAERLFKQALKAGESCYRRSQQLQHHSTQYEAQHSEYAAGDAPAAPVPGN